MGILKQSMLTLTLLGLVACSTTKALERPRPDRLSPDNFAQIQQLIKPQPGESLWRHVPWETSLTEARRKAAALGKPLLIWSGGGSAPLGGC